MKGSEHPIDYRFLLLVLLGTFLLSVIPGRIRASTDPVEHPRGVLEGFVDQVADSPGSVPADSLTLTDSSRRAVGTFLLSVLEARSRDRSDTDFARAVETLRRRYGLPASNCDWDRSASMSAERTDRFLRDVSALAKDHVVADSLGRSDGVDTNTFSDVRYYQRDDGRWLVNVLPDWDRAPLLTLERRNGRWVLGGIEWIYTWLIQSFVTAEEADTRPRRIDSDTYEKMLSDSSESPPVQVRFTDLDLREDVMLEFEVRAPLLPNLVIRNVGPASDVDFGLGALQTKQGRLDRQNYGSYWDSSLSYRKFNRVCDGFVDEKWVRLDPDVDLTRLNELSGTVRLAPPSDFDIVGVEPEDFVTPVETRRLRGYLYRMASRRFLFDTESLPEELWTVRGVADRGIPLERATSSSWGPLKLTFKSEPDQIQFYLVTDRFERDYPVSAPIRIDRSVLEPLDSADTETPLIQVEVLEQKKGTALHLDLTDFSGNLLDVYGLTSSGDRVHLEGRSVFDLEGADHQVLVFSRSVDRLVVYTSDG